MLINQDVPQRVKFVQLVHLQAVALHVDYLLRAEPVPKQESTGFKNNFILKPLPINRSTGLDPPCDRGLDRSGAADLQTLTYKYM